MEELKVTDIINDDCNVNLGTEEGRALLDKSIEKFGLGRSILLDKNNRVIAGNKTLEEAIKAGKVKVRVVDSTGDKLIAVKRTDVDLDSTLGRELALADNVVAKTNIKFDDDALAKLKENFGTDREQWGLQKAKAKLMTAQEKEEFDLNEGLDPSLAICPICYTEFEPED